MPISRYQVRNVYSLADPDIYKAADKNDPEALLEGVSMSGLVGVLRQLGDLAEFAAQIFNDLHEEVMATAARGHGLSLRVQQLELEIPSIERTLLSETCHPQFFPNSGVDWHPNRQTTQNLITTGDLPRCVMDSYEDCRGPPRLFLLDKFDVGGSGTCLKRFTDPSFYKVAASLYEIGSAKTQKNNKICKTTKKVSLLKGGETPKVSPASRVKLHQLFLKEIVQTGTLEPAQRGKLKKRPNKFSIESESGKSYMNKFLHSSLEDKLVHEVPICLTSHSNRSNESRPEILEVSTVSSTLGWAMQSRNLFAASSSIEDTVRGDPTSRLEILEDSTVGSALGSAMQRRSPHVASSSVEESIRGDQASTLQILEKGRVGSSLGLSMKSTSPCVASSSVEETICRDPANNLSVERQTSVLPSLVEDEVDEKQIAFDVEIKSDGRQTGCIYDDVASEMDDYVDALGTMESELEIDAEFGSKTDPSIYKRIYSDANTDQLRSQSSSSKSIGNLTVSGDGSHWPRKGITNYMNSDTASTSNEYTSSVGVTSPPRPFACGEIPFHPRVPHKKVSITENIPVLNQNIANDISLNVIKLQDVSSATLVNQVAILEEGTSKEADSNKGKEILTSPRKKEERNHDREINVDGHSTFSFVRNIEVDGDNKHLNDKIHRTSEYLSSQFTECSAHDNNSTDPVVSRFSSPDSVTSHVDEKSFSPYLASHGIHHLDVEASDTNDSHIAGVTAASPPEIYSSPEEQLQEIGDDNILHTSGSSESLVVSYSIKDDETEEANKINIQLATGVVPDLADANGSRGNDGSFLRIRGDPVCIRDENEEDDLSMLEDDAELERRQADSVNSETEKSDDVIAVDGQSIVNKLFIAQDSKEIGEKEEAGHLFITSPDSEYVPCDDDGSSKLSFDRIPDASMDSDDPQQKSIMLEMLQVSNHDINLCDQVRHQSIPVFPGLAIHPRSAPVQLDDMPPLPPLPPKQWRMRKLPAFLTPIDGGQHSCYDFPPIASSGADGSFSQMALREASLHTEDPVKSSSSEAEFAENLVPQAATDSEHSHSGPTSGQEVFGASSNPHSIPLADDMPTGIRPMKLQRPRSPLIDAVATHDKSKLRKVTDVAMPQVPKGEKIENLLAQIRSKSFNLKPAVLTRPSIQGPKTNLRVAAILEKANAIRQAFVGSDDEEEDGDSDSWSDL